jgi:hypothetical protein
MVWALEYLARIEIDLGRVAEGAALAGACEAARSWLGGGWSPVIVGLEDAATRAAALLGPGEAAAAIDRGRGLDLDEAVRLARHQTVLV